MKKEKFKREQIEKKRKADRIETKVSYGRTKRNHVYELTEIALMSAVFCVLAPIAMPLPFSPVPITFGTFVLYLTAAVLGCQKGTISVAVYLLIGLAGLPVFSGFTAGFTKLLGPGGGYMIGYLPAALLIGWLADKAMKQGNVDEKRIRQRIRLAGILACGAVVCYAFGTVWFLLVMDGTYTIGQALFVCVLPFLPFELIKIVLASVIVLPVRQKLRRAGLLKKEEFL